MVLRDRAKSERLKAEALNPDGEMEATVYRVVPHVRLDKSGKREVVPNLWDVKEITLRAKPAESKTIEKAMPLAVARSIFRLHRARQAQSGDLAQGP